MTTTAAPLTISPELQTFVEQEVLPGIGVDASTFWTGLAELLEAMIPRNAALLAVRDQLQATIDAWHTSGGSGEPADVVAHLSEIGYLQPEGPDFAITTSGVDEEIASLAGPQLVVPVTNARYALNAANARWGSLYDAVYGTDVLGEPPPAGPYDRDRGSRVVAWVQRVLDDAVPLGGASHGDVVDYRVGENGLQAQTADGVAQLVDPGQLVGHQGPGEAPSGILLRHHGLGIHLSLDREHPVGRDHPAGLADVVLEAAVTTIIDCEDSVATVDAADKVAAYRNWLGLMQGSLAAEVDKGGRSFTREAAHDRRYTTPDGGEATLPGRALLLVRNVGMHLRSHAVTTAGGQPVPEHLLDALVTVACAVHDLTGPARGRNSRAGSVYVVQPKLHGSEEVAYIVEVFSRVESILGLPHNTVKLGLMDEERRTSANLMECIRAARERVAFINTGFLDRTGDEIHTSMRAGPMVPKAEMKAQPWLRAYEARNVAIGLRCGLAGRAQIGKGMWAAPDLMADMLAQKVGHLQAGASCAWVPSPTAATLHALHYHAVDVGEVQQRLASHPVPPLEALLTIPVADPVWDEAARRRELENNAQGVLGYVVRWVDSGVGCSKVPDIDGVAQMEDRATCRISSQHIANWLHHGVVTEAQVRDVMEKMAVLVDEQNAGDPDYRPMGATLDGPAFRAALALVLRGRDEPSGYTEAILHDHRREAKRLALQPR